MPKSANQLPTVSPAQAAAFRLRRHHLFENGSPGEIENGSPGEITICRDVCGIQAQVMAAAYLQLWTRNHELTRANIAKALGGARSLVKTTSMRQTLHIIPADEFPLYIAALKSSLVAFAWRIMSKFGIQAEESDALTALIMEALASGPLTRGEISAAIRPHVSRRVRSCMEKVWSILRIPIAQGLICYGPGEGNQVKFIRVADWLPKMKAISEAKAQVALLRKYLRAYGPATVKDFAHWSGIPMKNSREIYLRLKDELCEVMVAGESCDILELDLPALVAPAKIRGEIRLLPLFDPYLLAYANKGHLIESLHYKRVYRNQGWISAVILLDGKTAGTWSYKMERDRVSLEFQLFKKLPTPNIKAIKREVDGLASFFGKSTEIREIA